MKRKLTTQPSPPEATQLALGFEPASAVSYRLRRSLQAGGDAVKITHEGEVLQVSAPADMPLERIEAAVRSRAAQPGPLHAATASPVPELPKIWAPGAIIRFQGRELGIRLDGAAHAAGEQEGLLILPLPPDAEPSRIRDQACAWLQGQAHLVLTETLEAAARTLGVPPPAWRVSFSARVLAQFDKGESLRLNWKLVLLPPVEIERLLLRLLDRPASPPCIAGLFD